MKLCSHKIFPQANPNMGCGTTCNITIDTVYMLQIRAVDNTCTTPTPLANIIVTWYIDNNVLGTATTRATGFAELLWTPTSTSISSGAHIITVKYKDVSGLPLTIKIGNGITASSNMTIYILVAIIIIYVIFGKQLGLKK